MSRVSGGLGRVSGHETATASFGKTLLKLVVGQAASPGVSGVPRGQGGQAAAQRLPIAAEDQIDPLQPPAA